jgi:hypothetical protein
MNTEPLFDYDKINNSIHAAKLDRAEFFRRAFYEARAERGRYLRDAWREASHTIRWSGLATAVALSGVVLSGLYVSGARGGSTRSTHLTSHIAHSRR